MNDRPLIGIARGGYSGESVVSMKSAEQMMTAVDRARFEPIYLTIDKAGWTASDPSERPLDLNRGDLLVAGRKLDAVLIAIHGSPGEDGLLQGYLDMLAIPYQTGDVLNMSVTFSKYSSAALMRQMGFKVADSVLLQRNSSISSIISSIDYPCFVKPDRSGSSLGISKVKQESELKDALDMAFGESESVMVESAVTGRELTCGVINTNDRILTLPVCEVITDREYFDYEAKYHAQSTQEVVPADIPDEVSALCMERSRAIYEAFNCAGMARIDHFWTGSELITIEINTVPGFSEASIFPKMLKADGYGVENAINDLINDMLP